MLDQNACTRNSWIAGGVLGLVVLVLSAGLGTAGIAGGIFLGVVAGGLVGAGLVWLVCDGQPAADPDLPDVAPLAVDSTVESAAGVAPPVAPLPRIDPAALRAPVGIVAGTTDEVGEGAALARPGAPQAPTFGNTEPLRNASADERTPPVAQDSPLEDTRAVLEEPAQSEDHDMPGESVPAAQPEMPEEMKPKPAKRGKVAEIAKKTDGQIPDQPESPVA